MRRRARTLAPTLLTAVSLAVFAPGLPGATAHTDGEHAQPATSPSLERYRAAFRADMQGPLFQQALGPIPCQNGFAGPFPCRNVDLLSFMPLAEMGGATGNDIWGWTDPATGREYALMGLDNGTAFVDITDPEDPLFVGRLNTHTIPSIWRDIKVYRNHAFIVADLAADHGMQVFDLTRLRNVPVTPMVFTEDAHYDGFGDAHNVVINEKTGFAYAVGTFDNTFSRNCGAGLHMVDIREPKSPTFAGCFAEDGYTHDAQCVIYRGPDLEHRNREICFNSNEDTLTIVDVTDKSAPVMLSRTSYPGVGYTHQGWLMAGQRNFALDDETDELDHGHNTITRYFDVTNLDAPQLRFVYEHDTPAIDHNLYVHRGFVWEANYRAGLRVIVAPDQEVGFFDVYPPDDEPDFNGAWSNYPFFRSGVVVVSGIEEGLFVLQPRVGRR